jgi:hypothetical protein
VSGLPSRAGESPGACWCRASYCSRQVAPGGVLCTAHGLMLGQLDPGLLERLSDLDPRGIESEPASETTVSRLEALASAVEAIAIRERNPVLNHYRIRVRVLRDILARAEAPIQGRLLEEDPDTSGAYGPEGRRR